MCMALHRSGRSIFCKECFTILENFINTLFNKAMDHQIIYEMKDLIEAPDDISPGYITMFFSADLIGPALGISGLNKTIFYNFQVLLR